jgi:hypothetical protein
VADVEQFGDVGHRQVGLIRLADRPVAVGPKLLGGPLEVLFAARVLLGKSRQTAAGFGGVALRTADLGIVRRIPANRLA